MHLDGEFLLYTGFSSSLGQTVHCQEWFSLFMAFLRTVQPKKCFQKLHIDNANTHDLQVLQTVKQSSEQWPKPGLFSLCNDMQGIILPSYIGSIMSHYKE